MNNKRPFSECDWTWEVFFFLYFFSLLVLASWVSEMSMIHNVEWSVVTWVREAPHLSFLGMASSESADRLLITFRTQRDLSLDVYSCRCFKHLYFCHPYFGHFHHECLPPYLETFQRSFGSSSERWWENLGRLTCHRLCATHLVKENLPSGSWELLWWRFLRLSPRLQMQLHLLELHPLEVLWALQARNFIGRGSVEMSINWCVNFPYRGHCCCRCYACRPCCSYYCGGSCYCGCCSSSCCSSSSSCCCCCWWCCLPLPFQCLRSLR